MNVSDVPVITPDVESETAIYLRSVMGGVDVRADLAHWDSKTEVVHVHRVGGGRDRFTDRARIAVDVKAATRDRAYELASEARGWLLAMPAKRGNARTREELGPTYLPVPGELPTVATTWVISMTGTQTPGGDPP